MVNLLPTANRRRNLKLRTTDGHVRCRSAKSGDKCFDSLCKHPLITRICLGNYHDLIMNICVRLLIQQHEIINRLEMMAADGGNLKRNFEREGVVVAEVSFSNDPENGPVFTLRDVEARESYSFDSIDLIAMEIYDLLY